MDEWGSSQEVEDEELYNDRKDLNEYIKFVIRLESIFRALRSPPSYIIPPTKQRKNTNSPWLVSLRVVTPLLHPISHEQITVTTSNQTTNSQNEEKPSNTNRAANTLSLLANLPSHATISGTQIQQTIHQSLYNASTSGIVDKRMVPRLLFTCTNISDEFYEAELTYEDLTTHRAQMSLDRLNWKTYLEQIHYGIFMYDAVPSVSDEDQSVRVQYEDETRDLLKLTVLAPLSLSSAVKLKYEFELCAVRAQSHFSERLQSLVFDQTVYSTNLYRKRVEEDQKTIRQLEKELNETRQRLMSTEDRLALFQNGNYQPSNMGSDMLIGDSSDLNRQPTTPKVNKLKRKAPVSLINPAQKKRRGVIGGAKIK